jgi:hypothetical protein
MTGDLWLDFWRPFLLSPGAAAIAALLAAIIAFTAGLIATGFTFAASWRAQRQRDLSIRQAQWWQATMWAADHSLSDDAKEQSVGYQALEALQQSPNWRIDEHQVAFISALTEDVLEAAGVLGESVAPRLPRVQSRTTRRVDMAASRTYAPEVYVAAAKTRVTSNRLLGVKSSQNLIRLANGDLSVVKDGGVKDGVVGDRVAPADPRENTGTSGSKADQTATQP